MIKPRQHKAIALFSGGLDSVLAVLHMQKLGYEVIPVFFQTPFFGPQKALYAAEAAGITIRVVDVTPDYLEMIKEPRYGFGKALNPCVDCHGFMFRKAAEFLDDFGADFLISGEVIGQRPMSQRFDAMNAVRKISGASDLIIRPLCQKRLPDTLPITEGWVDKEEMLDFYGRGRKKQMELAEAYGITEYHNPGGGCLLTEKGFSFRARDLFDHAMLTERSTRFLLFGRHFRLSPQAKLVVGKTAGDNQSISDLVTDETVIKAEQSPGPIGVLQHTGALTESEIALAASIVLHFTPKSPPEGKVFYGENYHLDNEIVVKQPSRDEVSKYWLKME